MRRYLGDWRVVRRAKALSLSAFAFGGRRFIEIRDACASLVGRDPYIALLPDTSSSRNRRFLSSMNSAKASDPASQDFTWARQKMVQEQIVARGIKNRRVLERCGRLRGRAKPGRKRETQ
jgi:hypothetical protein